MSAERIDVLAVMDFSVRVIRDPQELSDLPSRVKTRAEQAKELREARAAVAELIEKIEQIERLSRTANPKLVDVPAMLGDIARAALARIGGAK